MGGAGPLTAAPIAAPAAAAPAPPAAAPMPVPTGCEPGAPVITSRLASRFLSSRSRFLSLMANSFREFLVSKDGPFLRAPLAHADVWPLAKAVPAFSGGLETTTCNLFAMRE